MRTRRHALDEELVNLIILSFKDSTYNAQFNLCFYLFCRPFPEVPAEPFHFQPATPVSLRILSRLAFRFKAQRPKNSENQTIKELCPVSQRRSNHASRRPIDRFETLAVAACSQNHSLTCESAVISGRVTLAGPAPASTLFSTFSFETFVSAHRLSFTFVKPV